MPIAPHSLPPNPSLVAIILIVTTRRGPRFVFHYPGIPEPSQQSNSWAFGSIGSDSESSDDSSDEGTITSEPGDTASRAGSVTSRDGTSRQGSHSGKTGKWSAASASTRKTTRTLREDGPDDDEDVDDDIEALDLTNTDSRDGKKENNATEDGNGGAVKDRLADWEKVLGYPTEGLEKLLSPPDKFRKKRFEVSLEELVFLGYPVFAKEDGSWKKKQHKHSKKKRWEREHREDQDDDDAVPHDDDTDHNLTTEKHPFDDQMKNHASGRPQDLNITTSRLERVSSPELSPTTTPDDARKHSDPDSLNPQSGLNDLSHSFDSTGGMSEAASEVKSMSTTSGSQNGDDVSMFHVVFVMNPPTLEYHIRVQEMYDNVVKKFSKALRYEQSRSGWVEKEARKILTLKNQAKENKKPTPMSILWPKIIQQSPLAKAIANIYTSIASNKIAHVSIGSTFDASIQIPQAISTSYVATPMEPQLPGLWLTTASMLEDDDGVSTLSPHAALLLLEDKETMLKEIQGESKERTDPLMEFIGHLSPTKSLSKLSASLRLSLSDMQFLARHLIYWRRARAIPPLHIRDTYIVSPNCDMKSLSRATTLYAQRFHALPSLPNMLQLLSGKPKQYGYHIPTKDHKATYMEILAWLMRGGWVTQLRTFAWVKVTPAVKAAVAVQIRKEAERANARARAVMTRPDITGAKRTDMLGSISSASPSARRTYSEDDYISSNSTSRKSSKSKGQPTSPRLDAILSPSISGSATTAMRVSSNSMARDRASISDTESISSARTAIPPSSMSSLPIAVSSPALIPLRPSPLHAVDNINPFSPPNHSNNSMPSTFSASVSGTQSNTNTNSINETDSASVASVPISATGNGIISTGPDGGAPNNPHTNPAPTADTATEAGAETQISDTATTTLTTLPSTDERDYETTLVLSPHRAKTLESRWLAHIGANVLKDKELRESWASLVKYFDGKRAIEEIAGREGWKRRRVDELMQRLEREGVLVVVRHW
ncbi:hypothetical protein AAFC00_004475 [Neodothiora populina]